MKPQQGSDGSQTGFTLVELILAMTLFAFMLLALSVGVLRVMRIYQADLGTRRTQQAARLVVEDITRNVRAATAAVTGTDTLCLSVNNQAIIYRRESSASPNQYNLNRYTGSDCSATSNQTKMVDVTAGLEAASFSSVGIPAASPKTVQFSIVVATQVQGGGQLSTNKTCTPGTGSEFCASTAYTTTISMRTGDSS